LRGLREIRYEAARQRAASISALSVQFALFSRDTVTPEPLLPELHAREPEGSVDVSCFGCSRVQDDFQVLSKIRSLVLL